MPDAGAGSPTVLASVTGSGTGRVSYLRTGAGTVDTAKYKTEQIGLLRQTQTWDFTEHAHI